MAKKEFAGLSNFQMPNPEDYIDKKPVFSSFMEDKKELKVKGAKTKHTIYLSEINSKKFIEHCKKNKITLSELIETYIHNM